MIFENRLRDPNFRGLILSPDSRVSTASFRDFVYNKNFDLLTGLISSDSIRIRAPYEIRLPTGGMIRWKTISYEGDVDNLKGLQVTDWHIEGVGKFRSSLLDYLESMLRALARPLFQGTSVTLPAGGKSNWVIKTEEDRLVLRVEGPDGSSGDALTLYRNGTDIWLRK